MGDTSSCVCTTTASPTPAAPCTSHQRHTSPQRSSSPRRGLHLRSLPHSTASLACSPAPGRVFDSGAVRRSPQRVPKRLDTSLSSTTGCEESGGPARVCALAPGCVGCCLAAWCGGFAPGVHTTGAPRRFSRNTSEAVQSSNQPPCAGPPHQSRWLDAITLLLHCGLSGEAAAQHFKAKDTPVTWRGVQSLFSP